MFDHVYEARGKMELVQHERILEKWPENSEI